MRQFKAKRERWWTLSWFLSSFWKGSCERNSANACAEVYISRDDINDVLTVCLFLFSCRWLLWYNCVSDSPNGCRVCLNFMTKLHYALWTEVIGDQWGKPQESSSKRPQHTPKRNLQKAVQRCTIVSAQVASGFVTSLPFFSVIHNFKNNVLFLLRFIIQRGTGSLHPVFPSQLWIYLLALWDGCYIFSNLNSNATQLHFTHLPC